MSCQKILTVVFAAFLMALASCSPYSEKTETSLVEQAAQKATRIVQEAQATALVVQAQAKATQIAGRAESILDTPPPATLIVEITSEGQQNPAAAEIKVKEEESEGKQQVEVVRVGFAAVGGFITIQFRAPAEVAENWWQGDFLVIDEETNTEYKEVPVMPRIGPLISKPKLPGQVGYVMLVNTPPGLPTGARVTVVLGDYRFEHVPVE